MLVTEQLGIITRFNPGIRLSDEDVKQIEAGQLVLVGFGSLLPSGLVGTGCIDHMFYGEGSQDLDLIWIDGTLYNPVNLKDFREILEKAAFHMKCINFCYNKTSRKMYMLHVYPQCCCVCETKQD